MALKIPYNSINANLNFKHMKRLILLIAILLATSSAFAQGTYHFQKRALFEVLPVRSSDIVFLGNSITDGGEWAELFSNPKIKNRGISGDRTKWLLKRLDPIIKGKPKKLFLMIGINDLARNVAPETIVANIAKLLERFATESPRTKIYVQSILPVNGVDIKSRFKTHISQNERVVATNKLIKALCEGRKNVLYVDLFPALADANGRLDKRYTNDGLHLMGAGYLAWKEAIKKYVK